MTYNKRKKNSRQRGSHTHGWGAMKKHRGSGNRGGAGNAGSGKRAQSNKPSFWHERYFGKLGFVSKGHHARLMPVNVSFLEENIESLVLRKLAKKEGNSYSVDLKDLGFNKLLGRGSVTKQLAVKADYASAGAISSIEKAHGTVILPKKGGNADGS